MDPLTLNSGGYNGTYKLIGGEISLDFLNTVSWPGTAREHDWLDRPGNVTAWAVAAGAMGELNRDTLDARPQAQLGKELASVRRVRSDLRGVLWPLGSGEAPSREDIERLNALVGGACQHRYIDPASHQWTWADPSSLTDVLAPVVWNAAHVLTSVDHTRIGHCPSCNWIFYDTSRNRSRRWCDMADCGSRRKALDYYHRTKSTEGS